MYYKKGKEDWNEDNTDIPQHVKFSNFIERIIFCLRGFPGNHKVKYTLSKNTANNTKKECELILINPISIFYQNARKHLELNKYRNK